MKKLQNFFLLLMLAFVPMALTSCGDDDDTVSGGDGGPASVIPTSGTKTYSMKFTNFSDQQIYTKEVDITFNGTEVSVRGLSDYLPDSLVLGSIVNNVLVLPEARLGTYLRSAYMQPMEIFFKGAAFNVNKTTGVLTSKEGFYTTNGSSPMDHFVEITLSPITERAAKPATPVCNFRKSDYGTYLQLDMNIPLYDVDEKPMLSQKLSYVVLYEKDDVVSALTFSAPLYSRLTEPMTEIPYNFTDYYDIDNYCVYINFDKEELKTWTRIGVQSIYRGGGEENRSDIAWSDLTNFQW